MFEWCVHAEFGCESAVLRIPSMLGMDRLVSPPHRQQLKRPPRRQIESLHRRIENLYRKAD